MFDPEDIRFACVESEREDEYSLSNEKKDLSLQQLHELFVAVGWSDVECCRRMKAGLQNRGFIQHCHLKHGDHLSEQ